MSKNSENLEDEEAMPANLIVVADSWNDQKDGSNDSKNDASEDLDRAQSMYGAPDFLKFQYLVKRNRLQIEIPKDSIINILDPREELKDIIYNTPECENRSSFIKSESTDAKKIQDEEGDKQENDNHSKISSDVNVTKIDSFQMERNSFEESSIVMLDQNNDRDTSILDELHLDNNQMFVQSFHQDFEVLPSVQILQKSNDIQDHLILDTSIQVNGQIESPFKTVPVGDVTSDSLAIETKVLIETENEIINDKDTPILPIVSKITNVDLENADSERIPEKNNQRESNMYDENNERRGRLVKVKTEESFYGEIWNLDNSKVEDGVSNLPDLENQNNVDDSADQHIYENNVEFKRSFNKNPSLQPCGPNEPNEPLKCKLLKTQKKLDIESESESIFYVPDPTDDQKEIPLPTNFTDFDDDPYLFPISKPQSTVSKSLERLSTLQIDSQGKPISDCCDKEDQKREDDKASHQKSSQENLGSEIPTCPLPQIQIDSSYDMTPENDHSKNLGTVDNDLDASLPLIKSSSSHHIEDPMKSHKKSQSESNPDVFRGPKPLPRHKMLSEINKPPSRPTCPPRISNTPAHIKIVPQCQLPTPAPRTKRISSLNDIRFGDDLAVDTENVTSSASSIDHPASPASPTTQKKGKLKKCKKLFDRLKTKLKTNMKTDTNEKLPTKFYNV